jgi:hypothetical protein
MMNDETNKRPEHVRLLDDPPADSVFDDVEALRKVSPLTVQRKRIITNVSVGKPPTDCYFRVHPDERMWLPANVVVGPRGRDDLYFVAPKMWSYPVVAKRLRPVTIVVIITWPGSEVQLFLVPKLAKVKCWRTLQTAFERGQTEWLQITGWDEDERDYVLQSAEGELPEPQWPPNLDLSELLKTGFADKIISSPEDPLVRQWRGLPD